MQSTERHPVIHFEVLGRDASALRAFYSEAFGWHLGPVDAAMDYCMVRVKEAGGIDGGIGRAPDGAGHVTFYVKVDDPQSALDQIARLGGRTVQPPTQLPSGARFALFADPEDHVVGLLEV
jgi:predicted enzyme related to lactoylglutathione lyase